MLYQCSFKISRLKHASVLELWPFGSNDFVRLLAMHPVKAGSFVAVRHRRWRDGFHPPSTQLLSANPVSQGLIGSLKGTTTLRAALRKPGVDRVVDLKIFWPSKPVRTKAEIEFLEKCFEEFDEAAALKRWGGSWMHIHDASKAYITLVDRAAIKTFFTRILLTSGAAFERQDMETLYRKLCSLHDSKCLLLSWFRDFVRSRIESADVHNYEQLDVLLSEKVSARK